jgi:hypothetical protein
MRSLKILLVALVFAAAPIGASATVIGLGGAPSVPDDSSIYPAIDGPLPWMPDSSGSTFVTIDNPLPSPATNTPVPCIGGAPTCYSDPESDGPIITNDTGVPPAVPESPTWAMMILGFCGLGFMVFRAKNKAMSLA